MHLSVHVDCYASQFLRQTATIHSMLLEAEWLIVYLGAFLPRKSVTLDQSALNTHAKLTLRPCLLAFIHTHQHAFKDNAHLQDHQQAMMAHLPCASSRSAHAVSSGACGLPCAPRAKIPLASSMLPSPASINAHSVSRGPFLQSQYCHQRVNTLKAQNKWLTLDRSSSTLVYVYCPVFIGAHFASTGLLL